MEAKTETEPETKSFQFSCLFFLIFKIRNEYYTSRWRDAFDIRGKRQQIMSKQSDEIRTNKLSKALAQSKSKAF